MKTTEGAPRRIVISGSSGFIGSALVPHLRGAGHEVIRLVRRASQAPDERCWNPQTGYIEPGAFEGVDAVINLGGAAIGGKRWTEAYQQELRESRTGPTGVLARAVAEHGVPVMISGSAVAWYGDTGTTAVDETTSRPGSNYLAQLCRDWEDATGPASAAGARVVLVCTGVVLAADGDVIKSVRPLFSVGLGAWLGPAVRTVDHPRRRARGDHPRPGERHDPRPH